MKKHCLTLLALAFLTPIFAQNKLRSLLSGERGVSKQLTVLADTQRVAFNPANARSILGLDASSDLVIINTETDDLGITHHRYAQTYKGIPVENSMYIAHTKSGLLTAAGGNIITDFTAQVQSSAAAKFSQQQAVDAALQYVHAEKWAWQDTGFERRLKANQGSSATYYPVAVKVWYSGEEDIDPATLKLAYKVDVYSLKPFDRKFVYVDAQTGAVLGEKAGILRSDAIGTVSTGYSGQQAIHSDLSGFYYRLRDYTRGNGIITLNGYAGYGDYLSSSSGWTALYGQDRWALDVHYGVSATYDFYKNKLGRNSIDNNGYPLTSNVNDPYIAYYYGGSNAVWMFAEKLMRYGNMPDGRGVAAIDITGHELTHGVTQLTSGLTYSGESGAMNESMSDIMGKSVQFVAKPNDVNWQISNDMSWFIRDMANPNLRSHPDTYGGTFWVNTTNCTPTDINDYCGVHKNSGVGNYMFYLLVNGGSGQNDLFNNFTVSGIGLDKADKIIYRTNANYLTPTSKYANWRTACIQAATDLYGASSNEVAQVMNAWYAVGVGTAAPPQTCGVPTGLGVSNITITSAEFSWSIVAGAQSYSLQWKKSTATVWETASDVFNYPPGFYRLLELQPGTAYDWRIGAVCSNGTSAYSPGSFTTQSGSPALGITVAGGNGRGAASNQLTPTDVFVDAVGNIYISDFFYNRIQKWAPGASSGITVAGGNGRGSAANQFDFPSGVFVDAVGNVYIADLYNNRIQKWAPGASVGVTVAGGRGQGSAANQLWYPSGIFVDAGGSMYIADSYNNRIQKWTSGASSGTTVAGGNGYGSAGNQLWSPSDLYVDATGNIYIADNNNVRIQKWAPGASTGITVAGGNGGAAANQLRTPSDVYVDATGNIYIADEPSHRIQKWAPGASSGSTVAGGNGDGAAANQLSQPSGVWVDAAGNVYVADQGNDRIQKFGSNTTSGLTYKYYEGTWSSLPNFSTLTPVKTGNSPNVDISVKPAGGPTNFAFTWEGRIYIPTPGTYTFETMSDDGSNLYFNSQYVPTATPTVNNDGLHLAKSATGNVTVAAAGTYPIAITFFANGGGDAMQVYWSGPNIPRQLIPHAAFTPNVPADITAPTAPANLRVVSKGGNFINLYWDNASDNTGVIAYDIYVGGVKTYSTAESQITADNLSLSTSYTFTVKARDLAGNTSASSNTVTEATTSTQNGLAYKYYEGSWNALPNFNTLTPVKTGTSLNVDLGVRTAGRNDNFALVWQGYITIATPGTYTFETVSDDGSKLYFNSLYNPAATPTVNNDGLHGPVPVTGTVNILAAGTYPICMTFFEKDGGEQMQVNWTGPGFSKQPIPNAVFTTTPPASPNGLTYKYYEGSWNALPNFNTLTPVKTGTSANTDLSVRTAGRNDNFAFVWQGYINITTPGTYTFETVSDDGSKFYFNSLYDPLATATVSNDGLHAPVSATGTVNIAVAGVYPIAITFFEKDGGEQMQVYWTGPGISRQPIPNTAFTFAPPPPSNGLTYMYYEGSWNALPNFNTLTPVKTGTSANIDLSVRTSGRYDNFAFVWQGYIHIPAPGTYTFETISDDGSKLYFNSLYNPAASATVNNDGLHATVSATGTVNIAAAGIYPICITFFEKDGGEQMQVYWTGPGFARQPIPDAAFKVYTPMTVQAAVLSGIRSNNVATPEIQVNRIYPNPFAERINIDFYNNAATNDVSAGVYDVDGKLVYLYRPGKLAAGNNRLQLDLSGRHLTNGIYIVKMTVNGETVKTVKLVKTK